MIQLTPQLNILLAYKPVDFRKGLDSLIGLCRDQFEAELYDGTLFVFRNRRGTALKVLCFDGVGCAQLRPPAPPPLPLLCKPRAGKRGDFFSPQPRFSKPIQDSSIYSPR